LQGVAEKVGAEHWALRGWALNTEL